MKHLKKVFLIILSAFIVIVVHANDNHRLIVLADMGNEPDEMQQMTHMITCSNEPDIEGLIAVTGKYLRPESNDEYRRVIHPELFSAADVFCIDGVNQSNSEIMIATSKGIYRGIDNEFTLYASTGFKATFCKSDPFDSTVVYTCGFREDNGGLWRHKNNQWKKVVNDKYVASVDINPQNSNEIVASTDNHPYHDKTFAKGVYLSRDGGNNWMPENTGLRVLRGGIIKFNPHNPREIILGTGGRGYFIGTWEPEFVVNAFELNKNENEIRIYPNPFLNTVSVIADRDSEFKLFSISGNQLKKGLLNKGRNHINLAELNSGVYILKVANQKKVIIKK